MVGVYFNDYSQPKYDLAPYTCHYMHNTMTFGNSAELRDHVLNYHGVDSQSAGPKYRTRKANYIQHANDHVYNFSSPSSMNYAMIQASLFDSELKPCLDTGEGISLCDRKLLPQQQNTYDLVFNTKPITITEVAGMQILDQYIETKVLLGPTRSPVQIKAYLINNLQPGLIIGMNVLNKGDIGLLLSRKALRVEDTEIPLCYTPPRTGGSSYYTCYGFINSHTNGHDVTRPKQRIWKPTATPLGGSQMPQNSVNNSTNLHEPGNNLAPIRKYTDSPNHEKSAEIANLASNIDSNPFSKMPRQYRRCKQKFTSGNLLHSHLQH